MVSRDNSCISFFTLLLFFAKQHSPSSFFFLLGLKYIHTQVFFSHIFYLILFVFNHFLRIVSVETPGELIPCLVLTRSSRAGYFRFHFIDISFLLPVLLL